MAHGHGSASSQIAGVSQQFLSVLMGGLDKVGVGIEVDEALRDAAVLAQAEDLALMPEPEVHLGELEPVIGLCQRL